MTRTTDKHHATRCRLRHSVLIALLAFVAAAVQAQTLQQADSLHQLGRKCLTEGKVAEGRELTRRAMDMRRTLLGEASADYITSLNNYALSFFMEKNYDKAIELQEQALALCRRLPTPHASLDMYTTNLGRFYDAAGNRQRAKELWELALALSNKEGQTYEFLLNALSMVYEESGDTANLDRIMALMEEHNQRELAKPCNEPKCMLERAQYYDATGNQDMARDCYLKLLAMTMDDETRIAVYQTYARFVGHARDFATGAEYFHSAADLRKKVSGEHELWAQLLFESARYAYLAQDYAKAVGTYQQAVDFYARHDSPQARSNWATCLKGQGNAYHAMKHYPQARDCFRQLVAYYQQADTASVEYPRAILRMAKAEKHNKEYAAAIEHHKQAMGMFAQRGMADDYSDASSSLQFCYMYAGVRDTIDHRFDQSHALRMQRVDSILRYELQNIELTRKYLSKLTYANSLGVIAGIYGMKDRADSSIVGYSRYIQALRQAVRDEFSTRNERERMLMWNESKDELASLTSLLATMPRDSLGRPGSLLAATCYDAELLAKGILLNSSIEFARVLQSQGDARLTAVYEQFNAGEAEAERLRTTATTDADRQRLLQLMQQNQALQLQLYRGCAAFADYTNYIAYTWRDVQQALRPADVAIEFAVVGNSVFKDDNRLVALVLTADMASPVAVQVCSAAAIAQMESDEHLFDTPDAANTLWAPLASYLAGRQRVFFSADGSLNRIGIEYLSYGGKPLSEQYEVYRLSSTKELCQQRAAQRPAKAALFGAIDYGQSAQLTDEARASLMAMRGSARGFAPLENTRREVNTVATLLRDGGMADVALLTDAVASKQAFASLSDTQVSMLHIATHGAYKEEQHATDAQSMARSLLAFAGANKGAEGLLTAADIAGMNLRQCDLAVLSACETGLGKLGDDGVFGLQRGFKNAGVHTLMMSLKKVYDDSTAELMIAFYRHLMAGATKRQALVSAQQELRQKGYTDAKHWATFILLDAL